MCNFLEILQFLYLTVLTLCRFYVLKNNNIIFKASRSGLARQLAKAGACTGSDEPGEPALILG